MQSTPSARSRLPPIVWVVLVVVAGLAFGALLALSLPAKPGPPPPTGGGPVGPTNLGRWASVLSGLDAVLLIALVVIYLRTYADTRARFALGLVVFLLALFFQTTLTSPAFFVAFGYGPGSLGSFLFLGSLFEAIALVVFLALSLE